MTLLLNTEKLKIPDKRIKLDRSSGIWKDDPLKKTFLRGPIPMDWLASAAQLPGKTLNVGLALWWLAGMSKTGVLKMSRQARANMSVSKDAERDGLRRLEQAGLIEITKRQGQSHSIRIIKEVGLHGLSEK